MSEWRPAEVFPPGEFLRDELEARGWTQLEFAEIIGRPPRLVNEIIAGKRGITPDTAKELAAALGTSAQFWMNLETTYQLWKAAPAPERIAREARLRERFPVREMIRRGWIEASESFDVTETQVLRFFAIPSVDAPVQLAHAARRSGDGDIPPVQLAWLCRVKQLADALPTAPYSEAALRKGIEELRRLTAAPEEIRHVPKVLAACGVRFVVVEPMPGSKIDGVCSWLQDGTSPVVGLSLRQDRIDNFWFVLRHELEHVLRGDGKGGDIIDSDLGEADAPAGADPEAERAANEAAAEFLVPRAKLDNFIARVRPLYSEQKIVNFAKVNGVHPGLVVGQLQNRGEIPYANLRRHLVKVRHLLTPSALTDGWGSTPQVWTTPVI
ncbi:HigA family addiction module antidote protein [Azospirillum formosense]|uniref:HigA family addiction module antidote protein n=1 Tax=Azospirillum formosense TaxID=861533 RepID=A0ABX2KRJ4_9PROT|nr:HigA family addiction module antitoxin [Azospirillum formosense]NUB18760.1 HigA family addiction module antidote protein [Azospirillum formosense]